jgi:hypothetical protein
VSWFIAPILMLRAAAAVAAQVIDPPQDAGEQPARQRGTATSASWDTTEWPWCRPSMLLPQGRPEHAHKLRQTPLQGAGCAIPFQGTSKYGG